VQLYAAARGAAVPLYSSVREGVATAKQAPAAPAAPAVLLSLSLAEDPEIVALEKRFHDRLGTAGRPVAYRAYLPSFASFLRTDFHNAGWAQAAAHVLLYPLVALALALVFNVASGGFIAAMRRRCEEEFDHVEQRLAAVAAVRAASGRGAGATAAQGEPVSMVGAGDVVTAADVTFAALASIVAGITHEDGYGAWMVGSEELGNATATAWVARMRARPAGAFLLRLYRSHRMPLQSAWQRATRQGPVAMPRARL
jgi:hypothetical protein